MTQKHPFDQAYERHIEHERATLSQNYRATDEFRQGLLNRIHSARKPTEAPPETFIFKLFSRLESFIPEFPRFPKWALAPAGVALLGLVIALTIFLDRGRPGVFLATFEPRISKGTEPGESNALKKLAGGPLRAWTDFRTSDFTVELSDGSRLSGRLAPDSKWNTSKTEVFMVENLQSSTSTAITGSAELVVQRADRNKALKEARNSDLSSAKFRLCLKCGSEGFTNVYEWDHTP